MYRDTNWPLGSINAMSRALLWVLEAALCLGCASAQTNQGDDGDPDVDARLGATDAAGADGTAPIDAAVMVDAGAVIDGPLGSGLALGPEVSWDSPAPPISLGATGNRMCFLTGVAGAFDTSSEMRVYVSGSSWYLAGTGSVRATARCVTWTSNALVLSASFSWSQGQPAVDLGGEANRLCGLTRVAGQFRGGGETVRTSIESASWKLSGTSQQSGVAASASCLSWIGRAHV